MYAYLKKLGLCMGLLIINVLDAEQSVTVMGHRGACGYEPENTLRSFAKALELGVSLIECDVRFSKDGELVVIHDATIDRTTNGKGRVKDFTLTELKEFDAGKGEKIPTLKEACDYINRRAVINIELKEYGTACAIVHILNDYFKQGWKPEDFIISSFNHAELKYFHELCPDVQVAVIFGDLPVDCALVASLVPSQIIGIHKDFITRELVKDLHEKGLKVFVWTVNESDELAHFIAMGVDGICCNYPDRVIHLLHQP
jgi:glycerophosphoryl diester phosphodiesterase